MYVGSQVLMKNYDQYLLNLGYSIEELVDKASDCLLKHIEHYQNICLFCGPGNNGADGLSLAIKLFHQQKDVFVYIFQDEHLSSANYAYLQQCYQETINVILLDETALDDMRKQIKVADVIIDAMFGFGLNSSPRGLYQAVIEEINCLYDKEVIAIDIPTGLNCNTGKPYQSVICATQTITLSALKDGFLNPESQSFTGKVHLEKLDVSDVSYAVGLFELIDFKYASHLIKERLFDGYKGLYGHIGMITGCQNYKGASLLSTKAAVYSGSGIVTVLTCQEIIDSLTVYCPEATTVLRPPILRKEDIEKYNALLIGSGLGLDLDAYRYVIDVFSLSHQPLVIDGDALTILSSNLNLLKKTKRTIILTPHMGEFKRLCDFHNNDDILSVTRDFAKEWGIILVLKGPYTIVTDGENSYRVMAGNKAMSSGGMGDVLAGIITSLLGQNYTALNAALLAVYIHGYAGDELAKNAYTVLPSQLIKKIPEVMFKLKSNQK